MEDKTTSSELKRVYAVYVDVLQLHKKYAPHMGVKQIQQEFIADANRLNAKHSSMFCNALTEALRQCYLGWFLSVDEDKLTELYTDLWAFHRKFMGLTQDDGFWDTEIREAEKLNKKYDHSGYIQKCLGAIADALEGWL